LQNSECSSAAVARLERTARIILLGDMTIGRMPLRDWRIPCLVAVAGFRSLISTRRAQAIPIM
jgi:hypothetical protein